MCLCRKESSTPLLLLFYLPLTFRIHACFANFLGLGFYSFKGFPKVLTL